MIARNVAGNIKNGDSTLNFSGHFWGCIFIYICAYMYFYQFEVVPFLMYGAVYVLFGLLPDIDTNSKIQDAFYKVLIVVVLGLLIIGKYLEGAVVGLIAILPVADHHRGVTHNKYTGIIVAGFIYLLFGLDIALWSLAGFMTHLFLDSKMFRKKKKE